MVPRTKRRLREALTAYCFILPNFLGFLIFTSGPVVASLCLAFADWDIITPAKFAGIDNFRKLVADVKFWKYLWNTAFLMCRIPISMAVSLGMAMVLNQKLKARTVFRTVFFLPSITAGIAVYILWGRLFNKDFGLLGRLLPSFPVWIIAALEALPICLFLALVVFMLSKLVLWAARSTRDLPLGYYLLPALGFWGLMVLSVVLTRVGLVSPFVPGAVSIASLEGTAGTSGWLNDPWLAKPSLMMMGLWGALGGFNMILYLAALQNIAPELYEAAEIDGASRWQKFRNITWPLLTPTTFFIFVTSCIGGFQGGFESAYIMTGGGPPATGAAWTPWAGETIAETTTISYYIFNNAYVYLKMGYAASMAWFLFLLVFGVTMVNWRYGGKRVVY